MTDSVFLFLSKMNIAAEKVQEKKIKPISSDRRQ